MHIDPHKPFAPQVVDLVLEGWKSCGDAEELVAQKFSLQMIVSRYVAFYGELLAGNSQLDTAEGLSEQRAPELVR